LPEQAQGLFCFYGFGFSGNGAVLWAASITDRRGNKAMTCSKIRRYIRHGMLPQLGVFEAVARLGNFTRAAEELHMAQPTVSVHIKKLTETIGEPLLEQTGKSLRLTPVGHELQGLCNELFETFSRFDQKLADTRGSQAGTLGIVTSPIAEEFASRMLVDFARHYPTVEVRMHVGTREELLERLADHNDDFYMLASPPENGDNVLLRLLPNPLVVVANREHKLAGQSAIPFARLASEPLLLQPAGSEIRLLTEKLFAVNGFKPLVRLELGSNRAIIKAVQDGMGVAVMPANAPGVGPETGLTVLDIEQFPLECSPYMIYRGGRELPFIAQVFLDFVRREVQRGVRPLSTEFIPVLANGSRLLPDQGDWYGRKMHHLAGH
jgi:DNA-binding transcriptional LysR family regulator